MTGRGGKNIAKCITKQLNDLLGTQGKQNIEAITRIILG